MIPILLVVFLPILTCFLFRQTAARYARAQAVRDLTDLQENVGRILERSFSDWTDADPVRAFLYQVGILASSSSGGARIMITSGEGQLVYPREEESRAAASLLLDPFLSAIQNDSADRVVTLTLPNGEEYLLTVDQPPVATMRIQHIIVYCPAEEIGNWVYDASVLVLLISAGFSLLAILSLWFAAKSVTGPMRNLCEEASRIGSGDYSPIQQEYSLYELDELRLAMNDMARQIDLAHESQERFFQNVSHELRNPLMSIGGYAQGIEQGVFASPETAAHTILEESQRLTDLVGSLLTLSRIESGTAQSTLMLIPLKDILDDALDRFHGEALRRGISLRLQMQADHIQVLCDEDLMETTLNNLLSNAVRYAKAEILIASQISGDRLIISISDDGGGIDGQDLPHLFERCYKGRGGQFGLGLAIAKGAVEQMNGCLTARNRPSGGAEFCIILHADKIQ